MKNIIAIALFTGFLVMLAFVTLSCSSTGVVSTTTSTDLETTTSTTSTTVATTTSTQATTTLTTSTTTTTFSQSLLWTYVTPQIYYSSPSIGDDGTVYIGSSQEIGTSAADAIYAINSDGTLKWKYETGVQMSAKGGPTIGGDGTIYCLIWDKNASTNHLFAINGSDGSLKWRYNNLGTTGHNWGEVTPAISSQEVIYIPSGGKVYALDTTGDLSWIYTCEATYLSSASIGPSGTIYINGNSKVLAIQPDSTLKWEYTVDTYDYSFSAPALGSQETVYVGRSSGSDAHDSTYLYALDPADGSLLWRFYTGGLRAYANPAVDSDGTIYIGTTAKGPAAEEGQCGIFFAINPDGSQKWSYDTSIDLGGAEETAQSDIYSSPAIGSDGTIYFSTEGKYIYALNPDGTVKEKYNLYTLSPRSSGCSAIVYSSPAIAADGTIYVGDYYHYLAPGDTSAEGAVYALTSDSQGLANTSWPRIHGNNKNTGCRD